MDGDKEDHQEAAVAVTTLQEVHLRNMVVEVNLKCHEHRWADHLRIHMARVEAVVVDTMTTQETTSVRGIIK